jgi:tetratricopeptide (TPR) repeat protein
MKRLVFFFFVLAAASLFGQSRIPAVGPSQLSVELRPGVDVPLGDSAAVFGIGGTALLGVQYRLPSSPIFIEGSLGYDYDTVTQGIPLSVSIASASMGAGLRFPVIPWLTVQAGLSGGYAYSFLSDLSASAGNPFVSVDASLVLLSSQWHIELGASYRYYLALYSGLQASAGISYDIPARAHVTPAPRVQPLGSQGTSLDLKGLSLDDIFPVFRTYYASHPLGKLVLHNVQKKPVSDIKVSFQIKEFMTDPTDCRAPTSLAPGESKSVDLFGLFTPAILDTTENSKAQARIEVQYKVDGETQTQSLVQAIPILKRSATTWSDDRRAAAFVTTSDPAVLLFSKNVNSMVKGKVKGDVNPNLLMTMAFFEALQQFGLTYSLDPVATLGSNNEVVDYIQFPRQTLEYKGGKCSDFSVLYTALLESVGIETAFITIPGHIFIAVSTGVSPEEARKTFARPDDLIEQDGKDWIPVEVTENAGFLVAWQDAAKEWRENTAKQQASFYPLHDAWKLYEPVGISGAEASLNLPAADQVVARYLEDADKFVSEAIFPRVSDLQNQIQSAPDPRQPTNALGVLYARYGQYEHAKQVFGKLLDQEDYVPALLNMGNLVYLGGDRQKALEYYTRAQAKMPDSPSVLLAVARVNHDLENYEAAEKLYAELKEKDPVLAAKFAYLDLKGDEGTRASDVSGMKETVYWEE